MSIVAKKIMMGSGAVGDPVDDQWNRTSFLSHFDGANNGVNSVFDDGSTSNHTMTVYGDATQGSFGPFARPDGEWAVDFDGAGDRLSVPTSSDFGFGTGDYTISFMVFLTVINSYDTILAVGSGVGGLGLFIHNGVNLAFGRAGTEVDAAFANVFTGLGQWNSIVFKRASGVVTVYVNGTSVGTNNTSSSQFDYQAAAITIGTEANGSSNAFGGFISNFRIVKGTALTPSSGFPTSKLNAVTNTVLLTCQSNRFVDNSASSHTITPAGNVAITAFGPILTDAVSDAAVNGASSIGGTSGNNYISAATSTDWQFGAGNFTVEFWTYPLATGSWVIAHGVGDVAGSAISWQYGYGTFDFYYGTSYVQITSPTLTLNSWQYITVVRNGATITVYKDGVSTGTGNIGSNTLNTGGTAPFYVGAYPNAAGGNINGYLSDVRVVKGTAVYTSNFTPPTAPLTAITNTKLLLNMADGQAIDSAAQNNLTLYGTAKTSTAQKKFGTASLLLDGNSDYAIFPNGATGGAGDWTIEMFIFSSNVSSGEFGTILDNRPDSTNGLYQTLVLAAATLKFATAGAYKITSGDSLSANTWYHVALCKSVSSTKMFIDGTQTGSTYTDNNTYINAGRTQLGAEVSFGSGVAEFFNGYMDDFRISNMARYTSNFTAPAEPFADKGK